MNIGVDLGSIVEKIYQYVRCHIEKKEYEERKEHLKTRMELEKTGILEDFLFHYYKDLSDHFYKIGDWQYAIAVPPNWRKVKQIDDILESQDIFEVSTMINEERIGEVAIRGWTSHVSKKAQKVMKDPLSIWMEGLNEDWVRKNYYQGPTFALKNIDVRGGEIKISHCISDYYSFISTCEYLSYELTKEFHRHGINRENFDKLSLDVRNELASSNKIYQFQERSLKVGVNIFLVGYYKGNLCCVLTRRTGDIAEFPGRYSVVPAGTFAPRGPERREWYSVRLTALVELVEECIRGLPDIEEPKMIKPNWIYKKYPYLEKVQSSLSSGKSKLMFTAIGMDLLAAKPEVCGILYLGDDLIKDVVEGGKLNFETEEVYLLKLNDKSLLKLAKPGQVVPGGAVSILEGLKFCEERLGAKTVLSDIPGF